MPSERYVFQGSAVGAALRCKLFKQQPCFGGSAALPPTGGCVQSQAGRTRIELPGDKFVLSFHQATAAVRGDFDDPNAWEAGTSDALTITAEASVSDLNILHRVTIQHMENHFSYHDSDESITFALPKPLRIQGVMVDHKPLEVHLQDDIPELLNRAGHEPGELVVSTVIKELVFLHGAPHGAKITGNQLTLDKFGTLFFGELLTIGRERTLSLLRFELNSEWGGSGTGGSTKPGPGQTT